LGILFPPLPICMLDLSIMARPCNAFSDCFSQFDARPVIMFKQTLIALIAHRKMSLNSNDGKDVLKDNQSGRLSLMETDEDLLASQELPPPKLDYCVECKDQEVNHQPCLSVATTTPTSIPSIWSIFISDMINNL
jgi:hypothetical protein